MHALPLETEFRQFADEPGSVVDGALLVARVIHPESDGPWCRAELRRLAEGVGAASSAAGLVESLRAQGFVGAENYYDPDNSSLEYVLRTRRGIPISLAVVLLGVAEQLDMPAAGINFPRHFLVRLDSQLVDPFSMSVTDSATCRGWLRQQGLPDTDPFRPAAPLDMVLRMLNNLRGLAQGRGDHVGALEMSDYQLAIARDAFPIHIERVDLWRAVGAVDMARHDLAQAISLAPSAAVKAELENRLRELGQTRVTLH